MCAGRGACGVRGVQSNAHSEPADGGGSRAGTDCDFAAETDAQTHGNGDSRTPYGHAGLAQPYAIDK